MSAAIPGTSRSILRSRLLRLLLLRVNKKVAMSENMATSMQYQLISIRDLQDSSAGQQLEQQEFPGTPSDLYLQGSDVRR